MKALLHLISFFLLFSLNCIAKKTIQKKNLERHEAVVATTINTPKIWGNEFVIRINTQGDFDNLANFVRKAIQQRQRNILVRIGEGIFYYRDQHLHLSGLSFQETSLRFEGIKNKTILIGQGKSYTKKANRYSENVNDGNCFLTDKLEYLDYKGKYNFAESLVEVLDEKSKLCRIKAAVNNQDITGASIQLNEWYMVKTYPITKVKDGYIYFTATDLAYDKMYKCYNVNYDYGVSKKKPRFAIVNMAESSLSVRRGKIVFPVDVASVHETSCSRFMVLYNDTFNFFQLKDITFIGSKVNNQLLFFKKVKANKIVVSNCVFKYIKNPIIRCDDANNVFFVENKIQDCFGNAVWSYNNSANTVITSNVFSRTIHHVDRSSCVLCFGKNFYVANNVFKNFGGMAIFAGIKYNQPKTAPNSGIIENNEIFYTSDYLDFMRKYSLIDGGAIYLSTHTDGIIVRYNYIHGFGGIDSKRSIYCDDGCYDTKIYGNVIVQPDDEQAVFEWYSSGAAAKTSKSNSGIDFMYNVIWGKYKMEERSKSDCVHGTNVIIYTGERPQNVLKNFAAQEKDVFVSEPMQRNSLKELSPGTMKAIMNLPTYQGMKKWFE